MTDNKKKLIKFYFKFDDDDRDKDLGALSSIPEGEEFILKIKAVKGNKVEFKSGSKTFTIYTE